MGGGTGRGVGGWVVSGYAPSKKIVKQLPVPNATSRSQNGEGKGEIEQILANWDCLACKRVGRSWGQPGACAYACKYAHTDLNTLTYTHTHTHTHTNTHIPVRPCTHTHTHTHKPVRSCTPFCDPAHGQSGQGRGGRARKRAQLIV